MTEQTDNHSWSYPSVGDGDYAQQINDWIADDLDVDVILKDTLANRPSSPGADAWFLDTDTLLLYHYDGSSWNLISGHIPEFDDVSNAPETDGAIVYVTGDGATSPEGLYQRQSGSYTQVGAGSGGNLTSVANDTETLSSGSAVVDTGQAIDDTNEYTVLINPDDGADIAASLEEGATNYQLHLEENSTSVGNPDCRWRLVRWA